MLSQNITVQSGTTDFKFNVTSKGYFKKTESNKGVYIRTSVSVGNCDHFNSWNIPTTSTQEVVLPATASCVLSGTITSDISYVVDGNVTYSYSSGLRDNRKCSGYLKFIVINGDNK